MTSCARRYKGIREPVCADGKGCGDCWKIRAEFLRSRLASNDVHTQPAYDNDLRYWKRCALNAEHSLTEVLDSLAEIRFIAQKNVGPSRRQLARIATSASAAVQKALTENDPKMWGKP